MSRSTFFMKLRRIILSPFRLIIRFLTKIFSILVQPWKKLVLFLSYEPEEVPIEEAIDNIIENPRGLTDHLFELRKHFIRILIYFLCCTAISLFFIPEILSFIEKPLSEFPDVELRISGPGEILDIIPKIGMTTGFFVSLPYILIELWLFVASGLYKKERLLSLLIIPFLFILMILGFAIGYYAILPISISNLVSATQTYGMFDWELVKYLSYALKLLVLSSLMPYLPIAALIIRLSVSSEWSHDIRVVAIFFFIVATAITPGTMILFDIALMLGMLIVYYSFYAFVSITAQGSEKSDQVARKRKAWYLSPTTAKWEGEEENHACENCN